MERFQVVWDSTGSGHVTFFWDTLGWLSRDEILAEMAERNVSPEQIVDEMIAGLTPLGFDFDDRDRRVMIQDLERGPEE